MPVDELTKNRKVKTHEKWGPEFCVSFEIRRTQDLSAGDKLKNILNLHAPGVRLTRRVPAVFMLYNRLRVFMRDRDR